MLSRLRRAQFIRNRPQSWKELEAHHIRVHRLGMTSSTLQMRTRGVCGRILVYPGLITLSVIPVDMLPKWKTPLQDQNHTNHA
jgi:hypothetical protein